MNEIERKYLASYQLAFFNGEMEKDLTVKQGYIVALSFMEWRLRATDYHIPAKGLRFHTAFKFGNGFVRKEYEWEIPGWAWKTLSVLVSNWLSKTRYSRGGWDVDIFHGPLAGLILAEAEVATADAEFPPVPVGLNLLREVTEERTFANKNLSRLDKTKARALVSGVKSMRLMEAFTSGRGFSKTALVYKVATGEDLVEVA